MEREDCTPYQSRLWDHLDAIMVLRMNCASGPHYTKRTPYQQRLDILEEAVLTLLRRSYAA